MLCAPRAGPSDLRPSKRRDLPVLCPASSRDLRALPHPGTPQPGGGRAPAPTALPPMTASCFFSRDLRLFMARPRAGGRTPHRPRRAPAAATAGTGRAGPAPPTRSTTNGRPPSRALQPISERDGGEGLPRVGGALGGAEPPGRQGARCGGAGARRPGRRSGPGRPLRAPQRGRGCGSGSPGITTGITAGITAWKSIGRSTGTGVPGAGGPRLRPSTYRAPGG